jgi:hypothetical protein
MNGLSELFAIQSALPASSVKLCSSLWYSRISFGLSVPLINYEYSSARARYCLGVNIDDSILPEINFAYPGLPAHIWVLSVQISSCDHMCAPVFQGVSDVFPSFTMRLQLWMTCDGGRKRLPTSRVVRTTE